MYRYFVRSLRVLLLLAFTLPAFAQTGLPVRSTQTGSLSGTVVDGDIGETLIGANVYLPELERGAATDLDGRFQVDQLPVGSFEVRVSYTGFETQVITGVEIQEGQAENLEILLTSGTLEEVYVEARMLRNNEAALLRDRQKAAAVSDAISAEMLSRSGSSNASEAMGKVTGASVLDGKYLVMRGLQGRYLNVQLNGATIPSADPDRNAVGLDLFPSGLLDNIVTAKTFTPDQPGDFTGGSVNLSTRDFPTSFTSGVSVSTGFNSNVTPGDPLLFIPGNTPGVIGGGGGSLPLPASGEVPPVSFARGDEALANQLDEITRAFIPTMAPGIKTAPLNRNFSFSVGNKVNFGTRPFGFVAGVNWKQSTSGYEGGVVQEFSGARRDGQVVGLSREYGSTEEIDGISGMQVGEASTELGGLANMSFRLSERSELGLNVLYNRSTKSEAVYREGRFFDGNLHPDDVLQSRSMLFQDRQLLSGQLSGDHALSSAGARLEWKASYARTTQNEPDYRIFENHYRIASSDTVYSITQSIYPVPTRYFREMNEGNASAKVDLSIPWTLGGRRVRAKVGGLFVDRRRDFRERTFQIYSDEARYDGNPSAYFDASAGVVGQEENGRFQFGTYVADATSPQADYDGTMRTGAGYLMVDVEPFDRLRVITGARVEFNRTFVEPVNINNPDREATLEDLDILPSLNLVYALSERLNVRAAYGLTVARPSFRELAPYTSYELRTNRTFAGNPDLRRSTIHNVDFRWEWFPRTGEILAVSAFYKRFQDPIEVTYNILAVNPEVQPRNLANATVYGLEFEARRGLDFLPVAGVSLGANLTLTKSQVPVREEELLRRLDPTQTSRALQGQSPFLLNLNLGYQSPTGATTLDVFYNLFGQRLDAVSISGTPDVFEDSRGTLDVTASQKLPAGLKIKLAAKNILSAEYRLIQTFDDTDHVTESHPLGRSFSLGLSYNL